MADILPLLYKKGSNNHAVLILHGFGVEIAQTDLLFNYFVGKNYSVARPVMPGHDGTLEGLKSHGPEDWLVEAKKWLKQLSNNADNIYIIGISFGSNLAVSLSAEGNPKIKAIVLTEMPIYFNFKMSAVLHFIQPVYQLLGIDFISKNSKLWRKNHLPRKEAFAYVPVKVSGLIRNYIRLRTKKELAKLKVPVFIVQAQASDLLDNKRIAKFICKQIKEEQRKFYSIPIDNHDLSVMNDEGKIVMLEKIYDFISHN